MANLVEFFEDDNGTKHGIIPVVADADKLGGIKASTTTDEAYNLKLKTNEDGFMVMPVDADMKKAVAGTPAEAQASGDAFVHMVFTQTGDDLALANWTDEQRGYNASGVMADVANYYFSRVELEQDQYYMVINQTMHKTAHSNMRFYEVIDGVYKQLWVSHEHDVAFRCPVNEKATYILQVSFHFVRGGDRPQVFKCTATRKNMSDRINVMMDNRGRTPEAYLPNALDVYEGANVLTCTTIGSYRNNSGAFVENEDYSSGMVQLVPGTTYHVNNPNIRTLRMFKRVGSDYRLMAHCGRHEFTFDTPADATETGQYVLQGLYLLTSSDSQRPAIHPIHEAGPAKVMMDAIRKAEHYTSRPLRVIAFGGHNVLDMLSYVPIMAKEYGVDIDMTVMYRTSMTLAQLNSEWDTTTSHNVYWYTNMMGHGTGKWVNITSDASAWASPAKLLSENGPYDLIIFNQDRVQHTTASSFAIFSDVMTKLSNTVTYPYTLGWLISPTYKTKDYPDLALQYTKSEIIDKYPIGCFLPGGTAWMNACTNGSLAACGASEYGKMWYTDNSSLEDGIGCYVGACACLEAIFRKFYPHLTVNGDKFRPTFEDLTTYAIPGKQVQQATFEAGMTEQHCHLAWRAAILANNFPFEVKGIY